MFFSLDFNGFKHQQNNFNKNVINIISFVCQRFLFALYVKKEKKKEHKLIFILDLVTAKKTNNFSQYGPVENICAQLCYKCQIYPGFFYNTCNIYNVECEVFLFHEHVC